MWHLHPVTGTVFFFFLNYLSSASASLLAGSGTTFFRSTTLDAPVEDIVILEALTNEEATEKLAEIGIIRLVVEAQGTGVVQEDPKFVREIATEEVGGSCHLLHYAVILLLLCGGFETLPGESTAEEVHENVSGGLQVVPALLLDTQVSIDGRIASGTRRFLFSLYGI